MTPFYEAMREVLQRPRYDILTGRAIDYQQVIMDALRRAVINFLEKIFQHDPEAPAYNLEFITYTFIVVTTLLLLGTIVGIIYIFLKHRGQGAAEALSVASLFDDIANRRFTLDDLLHLSHEYAKKGQFRDAVRHHYIAVLVDLHNKKTIRVDKSKTNAQLIRELTLAAPALSDSFVSVVDVFHDVWFGRKAVDENRYYHYKTNAEELLHEK